MHGYPKNPYSTIVRQRLRVAVNTGGNNFKQFQIMSNNFKQFQGQVRSQENKFAGAIWDCLPVTEKEKDSIAFAALCPEVRADHMDVL